MNLPIDQFSRLSQANLELALKLSETILASSERLYDINSKMLQEVVEEAGTATRRTIAPAAQSTGDDATGHGWEDIIADGQQWQQATIEGISAAFETWQKACLGLDPGKDGTAIPRLCPWPVSSKASLAE